MKEQLQELFDGLNHLCETNEAFYFSEQDYGDNHIVRSYAYRLATWADFQLPYALDCRGTAFVLDKRTNKWSLFARAYKKFFNLGENVPKEDYIKNNNPLYSFEKLDGSLILVGKIEGRLVAKSKTSINSDHAKRAQELIDVNVKLSEYLCDEINDGFTPVMELVGPGEFRIVLSYKQDELVWLGSVEHINYNVLPVEINPEVFQEMAGIRCAIIYEFSWDELINIQENSKPDIEGFVVKTESGFVKCKVQSYCNLHRLKDNVNNLKNLIQLILSDDLDDLMGQFQDDKDTLDYILEIQDIVSKKFNHLVVEFKALRGSYYNQYNENRKEFAIKNSKHPLFGYVMKSIGGSFRDIEQIAEGQVRTYIEKQCNSLSKAKEWVEEL